MVGETMIGKVCIVRTYSAGVHYGEVAAIEGTAIHLKNARRIWRWNGAFTLSEISVNGVKSQSRIAVSVPEILLTQAIEVIPMSEKAIEVLNAINE